MRYLNGMNSQAIISHKALEVDECALISRIAQHDSQALTAFYELTVARVNAVVMRVLRHAADAEEVISDVYLQVWDKAKSFDAERGTVMAWINTLAWSRAVDRLRKSKRENLHQSLHPEADESAYTECEDLSLSPEQIAQSWSASRQIQAAYHCLSDVQKRVLQLNYTEDMSHQDIATAMNLPLGTVKSHIRRGLAALREALQEQGTQ
jgi:RNA polymerase sigma-70 factor, ECF subfamily